MSEQVPEGPHERLVGPADDIFADRPAVKVGSIHWGTLRAILRWEQRHGIARVTDTDLDAYRAEGYTPAVAGLELGLVDYAEVYGEED